MGCACNEMTHLRQVWLGRLVCWCSEPMRSACRRSAGLHISSEYRLYIYLLFFLIDYLWLLKIFFLYVGFSTKGAQEQNIKNVCNSFCSSIVLVIAIYSSPLMVQEKSDRKYVDKSMLGTPVAMWTAYAVWTYPYRIPVSSFTYNFLYFNASCSVHSMFLCLFHN